MFRTRSLNLYQQYQTMKCARKKRKTIFVILPQLKTFLGTFHNFVLLIKTSNTYVTSFGIRFSFVNS